MGKLFGTDGVRGIAGADLSCRLAFSLAQAAGVVLARSAGQKPLFIIGKDTRISSDMLEAAMVAGLCSVGAEVRLLGVIPTPAVAYLVQKYNADAGVVISASHNPMEYNGIKIFNSQGYKLSDALEEEIEELVLNNAPISVKQGDQIGRVIHCQDAAAEYVNYLTGCFPNSLKGLKVAVDCANGACSRTAPLLFERLGADCMFISSTPDGTNINRECGSTNLQALGRLVREKGLDVGIAFDGDADRCMAVDENGEVINGDRLMALFALDLKARERLKNNTLVATSMSNLGLHKLAKDYKINLVLTDVGDRNVLEAMLKGDFVVGGEQSGHIILRDFATTGDGELAALAFLNILLKSGNKASQIARVMQEYPQVMVNIAVSAEGKRACTEDLQIRNKIDEVSGKLGDNGRVLVRPSGTESLVRVMLEGPMKNEIEGMANEIADLIKLKYGT